MIYLDNAATSYPKPECVIKTVINTMENYGANPGRSGYLMAFETAEKIYEAREAVRKMFNAKSAENVVFTHNCTTALNICIKSLATKGSNIVCSSFEHNAVMRPLEKLRADGFCEYRVAQIVIDNDDETVKNFDNIIDEDTTAVILCAASNVCGYVPPIKKISLLCKKRNIPLVADGAQACGIIPFDCVELGIDYLCVAAHKGLFAPVGTGILIINTDKIPDALILGGTGSNSLSLIQPDFLPDRLESGTMNTYGIIAVKSGIDFINETGINNIYSHEHSLLQLMNDELKSMKNVDVYYPTKRNGLTSPVLSFNLKGFHSEQISQLLAENGVCVRGGYHCSYMAHKTLGTLESGTVRISPSFFTKKEDIYFTINCIYKLQK